MGGNLIFNGLARCDQMVNAVLQDGTVLEPRTKLHLMYCNLLGRMEEADLVTESDVVDLHASLTSNLATVSGKDAWCLYFDAMGGRDSLSQYEVEANLLFLGSFATVDQFLIIFNQIPIEKLSYPASLRIFRQGVAPSVDDERNIDGGRWVAKGPARERGSLWLDMVISLVNTSNDIAKSGCVMHASYAGSKEGDTLQLWVRGSAPGNDKTIRAMSQNFSFSQEHRSLAFSYIPHKISYPAAIPQPACPVRSECSETFSQSAQLGGAEPVQSKMYSHQPYLTDPVPVPVMQYPKPANNWNRNTELEEVAPLQPEMNSFAPFRKFEPHTAPPPVNPIPAPAPAAVPAPEVELKEAKSPSSHSTDSPPDLEISQVSEDTVVAKKKKKNKPDKYQRERLRKKRQRQEDLENAVVDMTGVACCECDDTIACARCVQCPADRNCFCQECFALIHTVGNRQKHSDFVSFQLGPLSKDAEGRLNQTVTCKVSGKRSVVSVEPTSIQKDRPDFLASFHEHADAFEAFVVEELGALTELRGYTTRDLQNVCDEFFVDKTLSVLKKGKAAKELITWSAQ